VQRQLVPPRQELSSGQDNRTRWRRGCLGKACSEVSQGCFSWSDEVLFVCGKKRETRCLKPDHTWTTGAELQAATEPVRQQGANCTLSQVCQKSEKREGDQPGKEENPARRQRIYSKKLG